jgi:hypothetical protein
MTGTDLCVNKCKKTRSYLNHLVYNKQSVVILCSSNLETSKATQIKILDIYKPIFHSVQ